MTLTADDVLNQKFTITKFRDGYDLDQVDDFLDSIVDQFKVFEDEKSALETEVEELKAKLNSVNAELQQAQNALAQAQNSPAVEEQAQEDIPAPPVAAQPEATPESAQAVESAQPEQDISADAMKSSAMLQLALELHDKYVREGEETKAKLISEAEKEAYELVSSAQEQRKNEINELQTERANIETIIEDLRLYESEYRSTLRSYIEAQLKNLDVKLNDNKVTPEIN